MPPAYIHLRYEIMGRFVQAYVLCMTAVFIPPPTLPAHTFKITGIAFGIGILLFCFFGRQDAGKALPPIPGSTGGRKVRRRFLRYQHRCQQKAMLLPICPRHHQIRSQRTTWTQTTEQSATRFPNPSRQFPTTQQRLICRRKHRCRPQQHQPRTQQQRLPAANPLLSLEKCHHLTIQSKRRHVAITVPSRCEYWWMPKVLPVVWKWLKVAARVTWIMLHCKRYATGASNQRVTATISRYRGALKSHSSSMSGSNLTTLLVNATWQGITC